MILPATNSVFLDKQQLEERLIKFSVAIIELTEQFKSSQATTHIRTQILRSGTSPALNYAEATDAESLKDFIHKLKIALKELRETEVALTIARDAYLSNDPKGLEAVLQECKELVAIFISSIKTSRKRV